MKPSVPGRLHAQGVAAPRFDTAAEVVRHLGCVQSQLHDMALWSVARRTRTATLVDVQEAFDRGDFLRTHILRPTWHFVDPDDIHWMLSLTAPRIRRLIAASAQAAGSFDLLERSAEVIAQTVADGADHTRAELGAALADAGLPSTGQPLGDLVMNAEISALVVNGSVRGKQQTYRALPPRATTETRDELLARIARRYATGHGPYRDKDLAWWTGLTLTDSRRAITLGELRPLDVDHVTYWTLDDPVDVEIPAVTLLSNFDEYISYARDEADYTDLVGSRDLLMRRSGLLLLDGRLAGAWGRSVTASTVEITVEASRPLTPRARRALTAEADRFGTFMAREPVLLVTN
ncbi:winged helix DNA-binding domain-containing protein [Aeromicrobium sp. UC242_57]|uniref:winged helix DNA-binding domain-containing protein n=1 Tax=Aeromicrobium sp. UC242_57 TaxID=3374624 RepID=UPI00379CE69C